MAQGLMHNPFEQLDKAEGTVHGLMVFKPSLSRFSVFVWLNMAMVVSLVVGFAAYVRAEKQVDQANALRQQSFVLAEELRQSSDDLTRMVRAYVSTGRPSYKRYYQEILDIRDGTSPRPIDYGHGYWYLVLEDERRPSPMGMAVPLLTLMQQAGYTESEFARLAEAKAKSDALTRTEYAAMALVESVQPVSDARRTQAIAMLYDDSYQRAKAEIMRPLFDLDRAVDARTMLAVQASAAHATRMRVLVMVLGCLQVAMLWAIRRYLYAILGGSVDQVFAALARLGQGDFSTDVGPVAPGRERSVLGWLRKTQGNLATLESERQQAQAAIATSERRFHQVLDDMMEGCMLIDFNWVFLYVNEAAARHGRRTRQALLGRTFMAAYPGVEDTDVFATLRSVMTTRVPVRREFQYRFEDGSSSWFELSVVPMPEGIFVLSLEVAERRMLADRLLAAKEDLEQQVVQRTADLQAALDAARQASQAKSAFLSSISHELRTPMNAILGFAQLLLMKSLPPEHQKQVEEIMRAGQHLLALINDLLDLTRIEAGQVTVTRASVDLSDLMVDAVSIVQPLMQQKGLTLHNRLPPGAAVIADPVRLRQVVVNLLSNAIKYNRDDGQVMIELTVPNDGCLRLWVRDTGRGIAADQLPRLFRKFERLEAGRQGIEGTGIGLALSRHLVELMGGTIGVESEPGVGSAFWVELPLAEAAAALLV